MIRATTIVRRPAVREERVADVVTLDHRARARNHFVMTGDGGIIFQLDLDVAAVLGDGDAVKLEDGRLIRIKAAPEKLVEVRAANPVRLMKVAWHLGNRHVPVEIAENVLYFPHDPALAELVRGLGAAAASLVRPFRPEKGTHEAAAHGAHDHAHDHGGAHVHGPDCGHDHGHDHGHSHAHAHAEAHASVDHGHAGHVHGPDCGHAHAHDHAHDHTHAHSHAQSHAHAEGQEHGAGCGCGAPHRHD